MELADDLRRPAMFRPQPIADTKEAELRSQIETLWAEVKNMDELLQMHEERIEVMRGGAR